MNSLVRTWSIHRYLQRLPRQPRALILTSLFGLAAGSAAVAFHLGIAWLYRSTFGNLKLQSTSNFVWGSLVVILAASLIVGYLLNTFCKSASGSGIPQLKVAFWKDFGYVPWRVVWVKFLAGVVSVGGGCSLGREGPSVQLAGGLASNLAGLVGEPKQSRRTAAAAGAAAGLAAAFNTPLAAITFVLEEIITDLNSRFLGAVLLASVLGAFVAHAFVGKHPAFILGEVGTPSWPAYGLIPLVAAVSSLVGVTFQLATLKLRARRKGFERVPDWLRPVFGGVITWGLGVSVFLTTGRLGVFGLGYDDMTMGLNHDLAWQIAGVLLAAKWLATVACYGFGGCGGIFSPTLFLGGMCGFFMTGLFGLLFDLTAPDETMLAVVGMSACLGAVVRAPMTSILIVFEMTHEFALVPPLMVVALISQAISGKLTGKNFYEALLEQDGHNLEHLIPPRDLQSWQQLPVSAIANFQPVFATSLELTDLQSLLKKYPYQCFPVIQQGKAVGILRRTEAEKGLLEKCSPNLDAVVFCKPGFSIRRLQHLLIESPTGMVLLRDQAETKIIGLVTLHDLLRSEVAMAEAHRD